MIFRECLAPMESTKKYSVCKLEKDVRIASDDTSFILQILKEDGEWENKFFYSWIGDALRGYIIFALQRAARHDLDGGVQELANKIESLGKKIEEAGDDLQNRWDQFFEDPVEKEIRSKNDVRTDDGEDN